MQKNRKTEAGRNLAVYFKKGNKRERSATGEKTKKKNKTIFEKKKIATRQSVFFLLSLSLGHSAVVGGKEKEEKG